MWIFYLKSFGLPFPTLLVIQFRLGLWNLFIPLYIDSYRMWNLLCICKTLSKGKGKETIAMAMNLNNLSDFQLMEILLQLPLKSVFQCKCVSKHWCSLISTPYFARRFVLHYHTNPQQQPFTMILVEYTNKKYEHRLLVTNSDQPELESLAAYLHRLK